MVNPILNNGELALEQDTNLLKVGNGTTVYNALAYLSSSANGLVGTINASVSEWSPTLAQLTASYPAGTAQGVLAYVTDTNSMRIGDGSTIGSVPIGNRYWINLSSATVNGSKPAEIATTYIPTWPTDQQTPLNTTSTNDSVAMFINSTNTSSLYSWIPIYVLSNMNNYFNGALQNGINNNPLNEPDIGSSVVYVNFGNTGSNVNWANGHGINGWNNLLGNSTTAFIEIIMGNGGNSLNGGVGGAGGANNGILSFVGGNAGSASSAGAFGNNGGSWGIISSIGGNGGNAISGSGGLGGNGGSISMQAGNGGISIVSGNAGRGGNAGYIQTNGGNGTNNTTGNGFDGGIGGNIITNANGIHSGGNINSIATTNRNGGSIYTFADTYMPVALFSTTASVSNTNSTSELNFWTSSTVQTCFNFLHPNTDFIQSGQIDHLGRILRIKTQGYLRADNTDSLRIRFYIGNQTLFDSTPLTASSTYGTNQLWEFTGDYVFNSLTSGATSGSVTGQGKFSYYTSPSSSVSWTNVNTGSFPIDTNGVNSNNNEVRLTSTWGVASNNNNIVITNALTELLN